MLQANYRDWRQNETCAHVTHLSRKQALYPDGTTVDRPPAAVNQLIGPILFWKQPDE